MYTYYQVAICWHYLTAFLDPKLFVNIDGCVAISPSRRAIDIKCIMCMSLLVNVCESYSLLTPGVVYTFCVVTFSVLSLFYTVLASPSGKRSVHAHYLFCQPPIVCVKYRCIVSSAYAVQLVLSLSRVVLCRFPLPSGLTLSSTSASSWQTGNLSAAALELQALE